MKANRRCLTRKRTLPGALFFLFLLTSLFSIISCESRKSERTSLNTDPPPVISSVMILPEKPTVGNELSSSVQSKDTKGDPITFQYQWIKNGKDLIGESRPTLGKEKFRKGDLISVRIIPSVGKVSGTPFLSPQVKIDNVAPVIQEVSIEPKMAYATDQLKAIVKCSDPDGDFVYYTYQWKKNGSVMSEERKETLEKGRFRKGDSIVVTVTPDDREALGTPKKSEPVTISNSPPQIISSPPDSVEKMAYIYHMKANEPDSDPVTFALKSGPERMDIDRKTGVIRWEIRREDKGTYPVEVEVADNEGAKSTQRYTLTVDIR